MRQILLWKCSQYFEQRLYRAVTIYCKYNGVNNRQNNLILSWRQSENYLKFAMWFGIWTRVFHENLRTWSVDFSEWTGSIFADCQVIYAHPTPIAKQIRQFLSNWGALYNVRMPRQIERTSNTHNIESNWIELLNVY